MKYVKLPIPIDAWPIETGTDKPSWVQEAITKSTFHFGMGSLQPTVYTLEGPMTGNIGDYLVKGVRGELYICAKKIFEETYVPESEYAEVSKESASEIEVDITDHDDGSATIGFTMSQDKILAFARIGIEKALLAATKDASRLKPMECGFADEDVVCDNCTCWKRTDGV